MSEWQPIETAPKEEFEYVLGYDTVSAAAHKDPRAGLCIISWIIPDEEDQEDGAQPYWLVQPFAEGLDCVVSDTLVTHWMPLPAPPKQD